MQQVVRRSEYTPPTFEIPSTFLSFELRPQATRVHARLEIVRSGADSHAPIELLGEHLELVSVRLDGRPLRQDEYECTAGRLRLLAFPERGTLETESLTDPAANLAFTGLYLSNGNFFTQCEAEGFRRITWFADRPDVMSRYEVLLEAPRESCPVLLSNGNLVGEGDCAGRPGWHWARWQDPFPKPSYLFALVAGRFVAHEQSIVRASGRPALLQVWVEPGNEDKTGHAMDSLVHAIRWDEERFGLELDLDRFMIVASADFNMGAMENKGLNIFNTKYVFANPRIATDVDFEGVEAVVGHEYFHNWTGNRVTCRDWFQLTLKEGLTVFRDQEFTADRLAGQAADAALARSARAVKRIDDVRVLRASQFAEDAGPMAHPIRPDSYAEINNFYTVTVYEKGAEVIRMLLTLLGRDGFRKGMDLYFERHDGQAVTCDDFVAAMADANGRDLDLFKRWYSQAGTPVLNAGWHYQPNDGQEGGTMYLNLSQSLPADKGPGLPLVIPVALGALDAQGRDLLPADTVIAMSAQQEQHRFSVAREPRALSLLRNFSAPVLLEQQIDDDGLAFLALHDSDPFNRWDAVQQLAVRAVRALYRADPGAQASTDALAGCLSHALAETGLDKAYLACLLTLPGEGFIAEQLSDLDPQALREARNRLFRQMAGRLFDPLLACHLAQQPARPYDSHPLQVGTRALKNATLAYLAQAGERQAEVEALISRQFFDADNMTEQWGAVGAAINTALPVRQRLLDEVEQRFGQEALVMDKWFSAQASAHVPGPADASVLDTVQRLMQRSDFAIKNPNRARALIHSFCQANPAQFHRDDGAGYQFWERCVLEIDASNPQVAARLARSLDRWTKFKPALRSLMRQSLQRLAAHEGLSGDVREVVNKALAA